MMPDKRHDGPRGIRCPKCGNGELGRGYVAKSYPAPGGQFRIRCCTGCHTDIETLEAPIGATTEVLDISGLDTKDIRTLREMALGMRRVSAILEDVARDRRALLSQEQAA